MEGCRVKRTERELLAAKQAAPTESNPGFASAFQKPESGPDLPAPC